MSEFQTPAKTYELNTLASAIGRFAAFDVESSSCIETDVYDSLAAQALDRLADSNAPPVPHTMPALLRQTIQFDRKLVRQLQIGPARELMARTLREDSMKTISSHLRQCEDLLYSGASFEVFANPDEIADAYGMPNMWGQAADTLKKEIDTYGKDTLHPVNPGFLQLGVNATETREMIKIIWADIFGMSGEPNANVYSTDRDGDYHLFWTARGNGLDYATPSSYDRATQLSFDIPHNAAHLAHLSALEDNGEGAFRFTDEMGERSFFEAVAVLSEHQIMQVCATQPQRLEKLVDLLGGKRAGITDEKLSIWIIEDRKYEFKLRAARLYADTLSISGMGFEELVSTVSRTLGIPKEHVFAEAQKYLPWSGLGAVYSLGYNALLRSGVDNVHNAIHSPNQVNRTWNDFNKSLSITTSPLDNK